MRYLLITLILMALSFGGGFWWEHGKMEAAQHKLDAANSQLKQTTAAVRLCALQDQMLTMLEDTANKNYGDAAAVSTKFFDAIPAEISQANQPYVKSALQSILAQRDQLTGELAKADPAAHDLLAQISATLHHAVTVDIQQVSGGAS
jgi:hypothetical protein